ncbi:MAG: hypothetical protein QOD67_4161, partial [Caballeronia sp.]|nr:hypothetical protein [Caballeronia sp.]
MRRNRLDCALARGRSRLQMDYQVVGRRAPGEHQAGRLAVRHPGRVPAVRTHADTFALRHPKRAQRLQIGLA